MAPTLAYRRLRAPRENRELLLLPSWPECLSQLQANRTLRASYDFELAGQSYPSLCGNARHELFRACQHYVSQYRDPPAITEDAMVIMSGHQPGLFHPGVWAKNFVIDRIAKQTDAVAVQVIIDNDTLRDPSIRVPTGNLRAPSVALEAFDRSGGPLPFECRSAVDLEVVKSFVPRIKHRLEQLVRSPLVEEIWPDVLSALQRGKLLGHSIAEARHRLEGRWGIQTLEVPISQLCDSHVFHRFVLHFLLAADHVRRAHNRRLAEYRNIHRLRSDLQPVPDLRTAEQWIEVPFWVWTKDDPVRRPLWCRRSGDDLELSDRQTQCWTLKNAANRLDDGFRQLTDLCSTTLRVRPRALTTTLFLRLFHCDGFVHGIGGAKYDQVTDLLMWDLFGIDPPSFAVVSQTLMLPVGAGTVSQAEIAAQRHLLREMYFHPERFLDDAQRRDPQVSSLEKRKEKSYRLELPRGQRRARHQELERTNAKLRGFLQEKVGKQRTILAKMEKRLPASGIFSSREWSFCLFPADHLRACLLDIPISDS